MQVLDTRQLPGGDRRLVSTECAEYMVIDRQWGRITRLETFDQEAEARADYASTAYILTPAWIRRVLHHAATL